MKWRVKETENHPVHIPAFNVYTIVEFHDRLRSLYAISNA